MDVDRETVYQLVLAGGAVGVFIAGSLYVGSAYGTNGNLTAEGGTLLVATIGAFVLLMLGAGLFLERQDFSDPPESADSSDSSN